LVHRALADDVAARDAAHVLVPWTTQKASRDHVITRAEGPYFWDSNGKRYLDFSSQFVFSNFGHGEPRVVRAIVDQASSLVEVGSPFVTEPRAAAASLLAEVTPGDLNRVFFSTGGSEANEAAFKMARDVTKRPLVCSRYGSYHGSTYGSLTLSGYSSGWAFEPGVPGVVHVPVCNPYRCRHAPPGGRCEACGEHCASELEQTLISLGPERFAAIFLEPIPGSSGGVTVPGDGYLESVREICNRYGMLLVADEVMTGFGRTGAWFACDHWGVVPDIMTLAKGLTGGYVPMGATMLRESIASTWDERPLLHGLTYTGHTLGCAAAVASVGVYREDGLVERSREMGHYLLDKALQLQERHPCVGDVRGKGLFAALELVTNRKSKTPMVAGARHPSAGQTIKQQVLAQLMSEGIYNFHGLSPHVIVVAPPLTITRDEIDVALDSMDRALVLADQEVDA
jgi:taurine--2-oxoglutarate transaminase